MKRLFALRDLKTRKLVSFFDSKQEAKGKRDENPGLYCVTKGLDHKDFGIKRPQSIHPKRKRK